MPTTASRCGRVIASLGETERCAFETPARRISHVPGRSKASHSTSSQALRLLHRIRRRSRPLEKHQKKIIQTTVVAKLEAFSGRVNALQNAQLAVMLANATYCHVTATSLGTFGEYMLSQEAIAGPLVAQGAL